jgi:hypothetical protein
MAVKPETNYYFYLALGGCTPLALARGGAIFHDKAKNY